MRFIKSTNPSNGYSINGIINCSTQRQISDLTLKAYRATNAWGSLSVKERVDILSPIVNKIKINKNELARLITTEMGKPIHEAQDEVETTIEEVQYFLDKGPEYLLDVVYEEDLVKKNIIRREPWGVSAVLAPWNYPLEISLWGILPNLICGNAVLYKPSESVLLLGEKLSTIIRELDLPEGVFDTIYGGKKEGETLVNQKKVNLIWFTGSTFTGQKVFEVAGKNFKKAIMELGGSSPAILFDDIELDEHLINNIIAGRFTNCGQICSAIKRLYVDKKHYREVVHEITKKVRSLKIGDPFKNETQISSLSSHKQLLFLEAQMKDALQKGAKIECGGKRIKNMKGAYFAPTILTNVKSNMSVLKEEVFGPILPIIPFNSEKNVIELVNKSDFGLSAEIYSNDEERAMRVAKQIQAGRITINSPKLPGINCPFGGYKKSGMGREHGKWGFYELSQLKYIMVKK